MNGTVNGSAGPSRDVNMNGMDCDMDFMDEATNLESR